MNNACSYHARPYNAQPHNARPCSGHSPKIIKQTLLLYLYAKSKPDAIHKPCGCLLGFNRANHLSRLYQDIVNRLVRMPYADQINPLVGKHRSPRPLVRDFFQCLGLSCAASAPEYQTTSTHRSSL